MIEERFFKNGQGYALAGVLNNGRPNAPLLIFVHGFAGNKNENGLFTQAEQYFSDKGINTFRFDMTGAGESQGDFRDITLQSQAHDLDCAIDTLSQIYSGNIGVVGFSLGAATAILDANPKIGFYVLWSPAIFLSKDMLPRYDDEETRKELQTKGYIQKAGLKVGPRIIDDFRTCDLTTQVQRLTKPTLLVHGTADPRIDYHSTVLVREQIPNAELQLIPGANHSYKEKPEHRKQLFDLTYSWLQKQLN